MFFNKLLKDTIRELTNKPHVQSNKLPDITQEFVSWIKKGASDGEFSFLVLTTGTGGSGKTSLAMMIANILMTSDKSRILALWCTPPSLETAIKKQVKLFLPKGEGDLWANRVLTITKVKEIKSNYIVLVDEGVLNLNAKRALNDAMVEFEKFITIARHLRVVVLVNSIFKGVAKAFRDSSQIKVFKQIPPEMIKSFKDNDFVKQNAYILPRLKKPEALIQCSHPKFMKDGYIYLDLSDYCPWYNQEISQSMGAEGSADFGKDADAELEEKIRELADAAIESLGNKFGLDKIDKWCNQSIIRGWIRDERPEDAREFIDQAAKLVDTIKYKALHISHDLGNSVLSVTVKPAAVKQPPVKPPVQQTVVPEATQTVVPESETTVHEESVNESPVTEQQQLTPKPARSTKKGKVKEPPKIRTDITIIEPAVTPKKNKRLEGDVVSDGFDVGKFFEQCALSAKMNKKIARVAYLTGSGVPLTEMALDRTIGYSEAWITEKRRELQERWLGYWTEWAWARIMKEEPNTSMINHLPDLITTAIRTYMGIEFEKGAIFDVKFKIAKQKTQSYYQYDEGESKGDLVPEYNLALKKKLPYYIAYFNPLWSAHHFYIKIVNPRDPRLVQFGCPHPDAILV